MKTDTLNVKINTLLTFEKGERFNFYTEMYWKN